jgi:hypothetical protein
MSLVQAMTKQMPLIEALEYASKALCAHLHYLDECGECAKSDDFVVALAILEDHLEELKGQKHFVDRVTELVKEVHKKK